MKTVLSYWAFGNVVRLNDIHGPPVGNEINLTSSSWTWHPVNTYRSQTETILPEVWNKLNQVDVDGKPYQIVAEHKHISCQGTFYLIPNREGVEPSYQ